MKGGGNADQGHGCTTYLGAGSVAASVAGLVAAGGGIDASIRLTITQ